MDITKSLLAMVALMVGAVVLAPAPSDAAEVQPAALPRCGGWTSFG